LSDPASPTELETDFLAVEARMATRSFVRRAHHDGKDVYIWTVNDPAWMLVALSRGVDGLITDKPEVARAVIERRAQMSDSQRFLVALMIRMDCERAHPRFPARQVSDVECDDSAAFIAPEHCARSGIGNRESPDGRIQMRNTNAPERANSTSTPRATRHARIAARPCTSALDGKTRPSTCSSVITRVFSRSR